MEPSAVFSGAEPHPVGRRCILVVEDEILIRMMLSDELRDAGYHVVEACNADEALAILRSVPPDAIISDVRMPGLLDGMGLLVAVREVFPTLPVIITSGHLEPTRAIAEGATQFFAKPYPVGLVRQAIEDVLANVP